MKITLLTNEYPPHVYGGAGVHVEYLSRELTHLGEGKQEIQIFCFGDQKQSSAKSKVEGIGPGPQFPLQDLRHGKLMDTLYRNIIMTGSVKGTDIVHCHTWYTHLAGCLIKQIYNVPLVITTHSLEPQRPWKEEQLGSAYNATTFLERTAYENADGVIAVSQSMRMGVHELYRVPLEKIQVIPNGIDTDQYKPVPDLNVLRSYGIRPEKPYLLFVGRISWQKGIIHLINAIKYLTSGVQIVLCAGAPDTEDIGQEMERRLERARSETSNEIIWIRQWVSRADIISLYTHASLFVCPSVYEPFGIINLEAMACGTPVVATAVGGIPEVVVPGETGLLVSLEHANTVHWDPRDPEQFSRDLAGAANSLFASPEKLKKMGVKARESVVEKFSWRSIARQTLNFYCTLTQDN